MKFRVAVFEGVSVASFAAACLVSGVSAWQSSRASILSWLIFLVRLWCSLFATGSFHRFASIGSGSSVVPKISCLVVMDDSLESSDYREPPGKAQRLKRKAMSECGITVLQPVIL